MVLIARLATQLMIDACQEWNECSRMKSNHVKTKIMVFYETQAQRASRQLLHFWLTPRFPLNNPPTPQRLGEPKDFTYLGLKLDPQMTMQPATTRTCQKINWAYQTVSAIAHSLKRDTPASLRGTRTSPLILYRIWQSCVRSRATQNLRYLRNPTQVQQVQSALICSLPRTLHSFTVAQITMLELGISPLILRQAEYLVSLHFRHTVAHMHLISAHLYIQRCQRKASNTHPWHSLANRIETANHALGLSTSYPGPPTMSMSVALAKPANRGKSYTTYLKPLVTAEWVRQLTSSHPSQPSHATPTGRTQAHFMIHGPSVYNNLYKNPPYLNICSQRNPMSLTRFRSQSQQFIPTHKFTIENAQRVTHDQKLCPYCDQQATGTEIHILFQSPGAKHVANDLIATLSTLPTHSHQPTWNSLTLYQQTSIILADDPTTLPEKIHQTWLHATLHHIPT